MIEKILRVKDLKNGKITLDFDDQFEVPMAVIETDGFLNA